MRPPEAPPPLRWSASFSSASLNGRSDWRPGSLFLDRPHNFFFLRNSDGKIEEGRLLRDGEWISPGIEMVLVDCVVRVGHRVFPNQRRLTLAPGALSSASLSPGSGSRFEMLAVDEDVVQPGEGSVAVQAANETLAGEENADGEGTWSMVQPRRKKTKEELVQEFWVDVGFPTPASHVWERRGSSSPAASHDKVSGSSV